MTARGELWWSRADDEWPVVPLSGAGEPEDLIERAGALPAGTMRQLELALRLAGVE